MFRKIPLLVWFLIPTIGLVIAGVWFFTKAPASMEEKTEFEKRPAAVSSPVEGTVDFDIVGRNHITQGTAGSGYNSNPPSSGPHWPSPAKNGVHDEVIADETLIHNLEHGYVWIAYKGDVGDEVRSELKKIVEDDDWKVVLVPRDKNETKIALVAWGRVLSMEEPDSEKVKAFIKTYRNRGPEKTPD